MDKYDFGTAALVSVTLVCVAPKYDLNLNYLSGLNGDSKCCPEFLGGRGK